MIWLVALGGALGSVSRFLLGPALQRAFASGKTACVNVKAKGAISPVVLAVAGRRDKASIE